MPNVFFLAFSRMLDDTLGLLSICKQKELKNVVCFQCSYVGKPARVASSFTSVSGQSDRPKLTHAFVLFFPNMCAARTLLFYA
jgi:hypothetical protein